MKPCFVGLVVAAVAGLAGCANNPVSPSIYDGPTLKWASLAKSCPQDAPATPIPLALKAATPPMGSSLTIDDKYADIARDIPGGWGGGSFLENSVMNMYLVNPSQKEAALAALAEHGVVGAGADVRVRQGRWNFAELYDWYRYLGSYVWTSAKVSSSDIQEARNRIQYSVIDEGERAKLEKALSDLDIPCWLVAIEIRGYATAGSH